MKAPIVILLEALLAGQQVEAPTGHTLVMDETRIFVVGRRFNTIQEHLDSPEGGKEIWLDAGPYNHLDVLMNFADSLSKDELFALAARTAFRKMKVARPPVLEPNTINGYPVCAACGGTGQGRTIQSCAPCKGRGYIR